MIKLRETVRLFFTDTTVYVYEDKESNSSKNKVIVSSNLTIDEGRVLEFTRKLDNLLKEYGE